MALSYGDILEKAKRYCAYQERATTDVLGKLKEWKAGNENTHAILAELKQESYLDDERFARTFVRGKYGIKKWGRMKIMNALRAKRIEEGLITQALDEIHESEYLNNLEAVIRAKKRTLPETASPQNRKKIIDHALAKGYELNLIYQILNK